MDVSRQQLKRGVCRIDAARCDQIVYLLLERRQLFVLAVDDDFDRIDNIGFDGDATQLLIGLRLQA